MELEKILGKYLHEFSLDATDFHHQLFLDEISYEPVEIQKEVRNAWHVTHGSDRYFIKKAEPSSSGRSARPRRGEDEISNLLPLDVGKKYLPILMFQAIKRQGYQGNGNSAEQKANHDMVLYTLKHFPAKDQEHFFTKLKEYRQPTSTSPVMSSVEIELTRGRGAESWRTYNLIPIRRSYADQMPDFDQPVVFETDQGLIATHRASRSNGRSEGGYFMSGLKPWFDAHPELVSGDKLILETLVPNERYRLNIKPRG